MIIVGELINATRKSVKSAIESRDTEFIGKLAADQAEAGANYIDVNTGVFMDSEEECLTWVMDQVLESADSPICIDSSNPKTINAGLKFLQDKQQTDIMINSISLESDRIDTILPIIAGTDLKIVALCVSNDGMPETKDQRLAIADKLINVLVKNNVKLENIFVDPLVQALATNSDFGIEFLNAVEGVMTTFPGVHTMCGLSNISFGMPARAILNQTLMMMAIAKGLDGAIMNPLDKKMMGNIIAAEVLAGKDSFCMNYLQAFRAGAFSE